ncbi:hypothetical protein [Caballeronia sp. LZ001]|uniref:hypothetical protein n=1 Tax=Caballeronia sp. LZ001 TaxID=3038553 RepID=UPI002858C93A|nr:hypothetical protein [Caballeronia sp. LZ001]MDR5802595.1 hypothetical protein [Caballeronia sp. LZ001]
MKGSKLKAMKKVGEVMVLVSCIGAACLSYSAADAAVVSNVSNGRSYAEHLPAKSRLKRGSKEGKKKRKHHRSKSFEQQSWLMNPSNRTGKALRRDKTHEHARSQRRDAGVELTSY